MDLGVTEYVALAMIAALVANTLCRRPLVVNLAGAATLSVLNMVHEASLVGYNVNPGWAPFMFVLGFVLALPVFAGVGSVFHCWREFHD